VQTCRDCPFAKAVEGLKFVIVCQNERAKNHFGHLLFWTHPRCQAGMEMPEEERVTVYTDGSCAPNPGPGGWAAVLKFEGAEAPVILQGSEERSTNNRMEMQAAIEALAALRVYSSVKLYTDSKYLRDGITVWVRKWEKTGWRTTNDTAVKNQELWRTLLALTRKHTVEWKWVKGHNGHQGNEWVDQLATEAREAGCCRL